MILGFKEYITRNKELIETRFEYAIVNGLKIHTIRRDSNNRWRKGVKIHYAISVRTKNYRCFKEGVCTDVQTVKINGQNVWVDNRKLKDYEIEKLALNDGFLEVKDFFEWFNEPFEGKIIHWTDTRY